MATTFWEKKTFTTSSKNMTNSKQTWKILQENKLQNEVRTQ